MSVEEIDFNLTIAQAQKYMKQAVTYFYCFRNEPNTTVNLETRREKSFFQKIRTCDKTLSGNCK